MATTTSARSADDEGLAAERWSARLGLVGCLVALVLALLASLAVSGVAVAAGAESSSALVGALGLVALDLTLVATAVWFARRRGPIAPRDLGLRRSRPWIAIGWVLVAFVVVRALSAGYAALVPFEDDASSKIGDGHGTLYVVLVAVCLAVIAPIFEELFFRGFLFAALSNWRGPWIGALGSSLIFGAAHALGSDLAALPVVAMLGFFLALVYWFTGSLLPAIALHSLNNSLALAVGEDWTWQIPVVAVGSLAVVMLALAPLARRTPPREPAPSG